MNMIGEAVRQATEVQLQVYTLEQEVKDSTLLTVEEMTQDQREKAFRHLQAMSARTHSFRHDWRAEIIVEIEEIDLEWWSDIVEYFTATRLERWTQDCSFPPSMTTGKIVCTAAGYRMGPAGP